MKQDISADAPFLDQLRENSDRFILAKYLAEDFRAISRYERIHDGLIESSKSAYPRS
jgi:hypothetical protein